MGTEAGPSPRGWHSCGEGHGARRNTGCVPSWPLRHGSQNAHPLLSSSPDSPDLGTGSAFSLLPGFKAKMQSRATETCRCTGEAGARTIQASLRPSPGLFPEQPPAEQSADPCWPTKLALTFNQPRLGRPPPWPQEGRWAQPWASSPEMHPLRRNRFRCNEVDSALVYEGEEESCFSLPNTAEGQARGIQLGSESHPASAGAPKTRPQPIPGRSRHPGLPAQATGSPHSLLPQAPGAFLPPLLHEDP